MMYLLYMHQFKEDVSRVQEPNELKKVDQYVEKSVSCDTSTKQKTGYVSSLMMMTAFGTKYYD